MVEHADGGVTKDTDVTVDDVSSEVMEKVAAGLAALTDDPNVKDDKGERVVLNAVDSTVSAIDSAVSATDSTVSAAVGEADSTVSAAVAADKTVSAVDSSVVVVDDKKYDLEDNLYRTMIHQGWKPEDIKDFMEQDPDRARATFKNVYDTANGLSKVWADAGRAKLLVDSGAQVDTATEATQKKDKIEFKEIDIAELRKQYDNDPVVDLVAQSQEQNKVLFDMVNDLREAASTRPEATQQVNTGVSAEAAAVGTQIETFFKQDDMKMFVEFYGSGDNLTPGSIANRQAMFETADAIRAGRAFQGLETSVEEALIQAHLLVSEPIREKMVRKGIVSKLKKRSNSLSLRPASAGKNVDATEHDKPQNDNEIVDNARARMAKIFN